MFPSLNESINFSGTSMNVFGLKYLAKFIRGKRVEQLSINGGYMPLNTVKQD